MTSLFWPSRILLESPYIRALIHVLLNSNKEGCVKKNTFLGCIATSLPF